MVRAAGWSQIDPELIFDTFLNLSFYAYKIVLTLQGCCSQWIGYIIFINYLAQCIAQSNYGYIFIIVINCVIGINNIFFIYPLT